MSRLRVDIEYIVKAIIADQLGEYTDDLKDDSVLDDFGADSLDCVEIEIALEKKYNIPFEDYDILINRTVKDITDYVISQLQEKGEVIE